MDDKVQEKEKPIVSTVIIPHGIQDRLKKKAKIDKGKETVKPTVINDELIR
jgi:hypothetical protein